ncbi:hypothetical protein GCM10022254_19210 [Actinomadura meridiana]|uniref:CBM2 domain-containing protein n=1 Tax=Actinomadura meridiana TaxID=559626 RepID=A0ABP8BX64_9ACTN
MDELSGEEPGYTPPDHRTTAEFHVPGRPADPEAATGADSTVVDDDDLIDPGATLQDVEPEATPDVTLQDPPGTPEDAVTPEGRSSVTIADMPVQPKEPPAQEPPQEDPAEETEAEQPVMPEQAAMPEQAVTPEEAPWTAQFGAEAVPPTDPDAGTPVYPPQTPPPSEATVPPPIASPSVGMLTSEPSGTRRPLLFVAVIGAVVVLAAAVVAVLLLSGDSDEKGTAQPPPSTASTPATQAPIAPGEPSPSGAPAVTPTPSGGAVGRPSEAPAVPTAPIGPVRKGDGITYQLVEQSEGYFEGQLVITNRTDRPMRTWRLTFQVPGANVRNIWGARLVSGGANPEIVNLEGAPAIPPGETWDVRFGAAGATSTPKGCELNGEPCGF